MQLLIVRHGEAEAQAPADSLRSLTPRGRNETQQLGNAITRQSFTPAQIWASPYVRAQQTAQILHKQFAHVGAIRECPVITPNGDVRDFTDALVRDASAQRVLVVSHQPFVTQALSWFCHGTLQGAPVVPMLTTSSAVLIEFDPVAPGCASMKWQLFPPQFDQ